jgi:predicted transcriptional regulator
MKINDYEMNSENEATELYDLGFNVFPMKSGMKHPAGNWAVLNSTRLERNVLENWNRRERMNLAVMVGHTSRNLFIIDCDSKESFEYWQQELGNRDLAKWVVNSSSGGHIWLLSGDGEVMLDGYNRGYKNRQQGKINLPSDNYQIWGRRHFVVVPPSINGNTGVIYEWKIREGELPPVLSRHEIKKLFPNMRVQRPRVDGLPSLVYDVLVEGDSSDYASNSEAEFAAVCSLIRCNYNDSEIINLFEKYIPSHYADKQKSNGWFEKHMLEKARILIPSRNFEFLDRTKAWANNRSWVGRTGGTDKAIFIACCTRAKHEYISNFRATVREVAEMAGVTTKTANNSLNRLVEQGYLNQNLKNTENKHKHLCSYYGISPDIYLQYHNNDLMSFNTNEVITDAIRRHDAWHRNALGRSALLIYEFLIRSTKVRKTLDEIISRTGKSKSTVINALKKLVENNLAVENEAGWLVIQNDINLLDGIAKKYETFGVGEKRAAQHVKERQQFARFQATRYL